MNFEAKLVDVVGYGQKHVLCQNIFPAPIQIPTEIHILFDSCGTATAKKIAELAGARVSVGRRVLYSVNRVQKYLDAIAK